MLCPPSVVILLVAPAHEEDMKTQIGSVLIWFAPLFPTVWSDGPSGTSSSYPTRFPGVHWDNEGWKLSNSVLDQGHYQSRLSLANGYIGINLAALGPFFEKDISSSSADPSINGWPLFDPRQAFATIAGFYNSQPKLSASNFEWLDQYGGESVISGVPHWAGLLIRAGDHTLDASTDPRTIRNFDSTLDIKAGLMRWNFDWLAEPQAQLSVEYSMLVHKLHVNRAAVRLAVKSSADLDISVIDVLDGECAVRTDFVSKHHDPQSSTICTSVKPLGIQNVVAHVCSSLRSQSFQSTHPVGDHKLTESSPSTIAQIAGIQLKGGQSIVVEKYVGVASSDAFSNPQIVALQSALAGAQDGFSSLLTSHQKEWNSIITPESVDDYNLAAHHPTLIDPNLIELQILAVTNPFHLLQNTIGSNAIALLSHSASGLDVWSLPVCGLGSSCYAGFIFWDAEVWMAPGLVLTHPQSARQIVNYRVEKFPQAQKNIKMAFSSSQNRTHQFSDSDAVYPWTSGRFGNCTGTGPCFDYEYHINGDIGLNLYNYLVASGDLAFFKQYLLPIYQGIAGFFGNLLSQLPNGKYSLKNATDPDEYANHVDNPAYTMVLIETHLNTANELRARFGLEPVSSWAKKAKNLALPIDQKTGIIQEYEGMNSSISVKQADVVLIDDFLNYPNPYTSRNLEYYGNKQSLDGPGMTYGVYSVVNSRFQITGCASYTYHLFSSQPYVRAPWYQFSEQLVDDFSKNGGTHPAFPFLTGMGGDYRIPLYGYLGLRLELDHLNVDPSLPPQILSLSYRTFYWHGHPIKAVSNQTHTSLSRPVSGALPNANPRYTNSPMPVRIRTSKSLWQLQPGGSLMVGHHTPTLNDPLQCQPTRSQESYLPGQFPLSITDGSSTTRWIPSELPASATVELNRQFASRSIIGFGFQDSQFTEFVISFYDDADHLKTSVEKTFSSFKGHKVGFQEFNDHPQSKTGWKYFKFDQPIKFHKFSKLTVFHPDHDGPGKFSPDTAESQSVSENHRRPNSQPLSIAEWTLLANPQ